MPFSILYLKSVWHIECLCLLLSVPPIRVFIQQMYEAILVFVKSRLKFALINAEIFAESANFYLSSQRFA